MIQLPMLMLRAIGDVEEIRTVTEEKHILIEAHHRHNDKLSPHMSLVQIRSKGVECYECGELIPEGSVAIRSAHRMSLHYFHIACGQKYLRMRH